MTEVKNALIRMKKREKKPLNHMKSLLKFGSASMMSMYFG